MRGHPGYLGVLALVALAGVARGQDTPPPADGGGSTAPVGSAATAPVTSEEPSKFFSEEDGWLDVSGFLDSSYGFLPVAIPITEPAVGYGGAVGLIFLSSPLGAARAGYGRPNITAVAGFGTENGTWGAAAGDIRYWLDDRLQTTLALVRTSVHLDYHGVGRDRVLRGERDLEYDLDVLGGVAQAKLRVADSRFWVGLGYALANTQLAFDTQDRQRFEVPDFERTENVGALIPSLTWDTRDSMFTPLSGTYVELSLACFSDALGGDAEFQRLRLTAMQFFPLLDTVTLGLRGDLAASFGDSPFFLLPFIGLRGVPAMRYQGDGAASFEAEVRWQFWRRFSLVGFAGYGAAWRDADDPDDTDTVVSGGAGFRYELARAYGLHVGLDVAFADDGYAIYIQVGGAWARP